MICQQHRELSTGSGCADRERRSGKAERIGYRNPQWVSDFLSEGGRCGLTRALSSVPAPSPVRRHECRRTTSPGLRLAMESPAAGEAVRTAGSRLGEASLEMAERSRRERERDPGPFASLRVTQKGAPTSGVRHPHPHPCVTSESRMASPDTGRGNLGEIGRGRE